MRLILLYIALALAFFRSSGQDVAGKQDYILAMKISFITKKLNLTPQEAQVFWPLYNQYQDELETLRKNHKKEQDALKDAFATMSNADIEKYVDAEIIFREREIEILKKYHPQFKKVLPVRKVALLYKAEEEFKRHLIKQIKSGNL
ncbi:MAG: hypothetical protein HYY40_04960 [Bacteroidetes bacterium]|nr:hypothetical protein [Bacteroidota bacterium]